jgi:hypothetical protein
MVCSKSYLVKYLVCSVKILGVLEILWGIVCEKCVHVLVCVCGYESVKNVHVKRVEE